MSTRAITVGRPERRYQRIATTMTSAGNRQLANADWDTSDQRWPVAEAVGESAAIAGINPVWGVPALRAGAYLVLAPQEAKAVT